jgi:hypothetical protein
MTKRVKAAMTTLPTQRKTPPKEKQERSRPRSARQGRPVTRASRTGLTVDPGQITGPAGKATGLHPDPIPPPVTLRRAQPKQVGTDENTAQEGMTKSNDAEPERIRTLVPVPALAIPALPVTRAETAVEAEGSVINEPEEGVAPVHRGGVEGTAAAALKTSESR